MPSVQRRAGDAAECLDEPLPTPPITLYQSIAAVRRSAWMNLVVRVVSAHTDSRSSFSIRTTRTSRKICRSARPLGRARGALGRAQAAGVPRAVAASRPAQG